jgi:serine protease Do
MNSSASTTASAPPRAAPNAACTGHAPGASALPLKAVVCLRAYKKLVGLHDLTVMVATLDGAACGVQGRLDAHGVSLASAQRLAQHYLDGFAWTAPKTSASR